MQARRAARELALILFSQIKDNENIHFQDVVVQSVRTLTNSAAEDLVSASKEIEAVKNFIKGYQADHPKNIERPIDAADKPVPLPMTDEMLKKIDILLDTAERAMLAVEIAEMAALGENSGVKKYIKQITKEFNAHKTEIDAHIQRLSSGWDINRLVKIDKAILRIASAELLYVKETPVKAVINEAVELAKKYSTEDSASFVNGILAKLVIENDLK